MDKEVISARYSLLYCNHCKGQADQLHQAIRRFLRRIESLVSHSPQVSITLHIVHTKNHLIMYHSHKRIVGYRMLIASMNCRKSLFIQKYHWKLKTINVKKNRQSRISEICSKSYV